VQEKHILENLSSLNLSNLTGEGVSDSRYSEFHESVEIVLKPTRISATDPTWH